MNILPQFCALQVVEVRRVSLTVTMIVLMIRIRIK